MINVTRRTVLTGVLVLCLVAGAGLTTAATSGTLELQAAVDGESDSITLSYTFTAQANGTAEVSPVSDSQSNGDVTFTLTSSSSFSVTAGETYTVTYEVTAEDGADEGTYFLYSTVNGPGGSYSRTLEADVEILEPRFESLTSQESQVKFAYDDTASTELTVSFDNTGDGVMNGISGTAVNVPSGMSVDVQIPNEVKANHSGIVDIDVTADESLSEGNHQFTVELTDSLGNTESFPVTIEVNKIPALNAPDRSINLGDVLVGDATTTQFTLAEAGGHASVNGISISQRQGTPHGTISFSDVRSAYIEPGGTTEAGVTIQADADAPQHESLSWRIEFAPEGPEGIETDVTFTARVIYPPYFETVKATGQTIVFDEPRSERDAFTTTVPITVKNGGDQTMQMTSISPSISASGVSAQVASGAPNTIPPQSMRTVNVKVRADTDAAEGNNTLTVVFEAVEPPRTQTSATIQIQHRTELAVSSNDIQYGRVVATRTVTRSIEIRERLGYQNVENLTITQVAGPDSGWLNITEQPETLVAGESHPFVTSLTFDTRAKFFSEYTWRYRIDGDNIEAHNITIRATPRPVDFDSTVEVLQEWNTNSSGNRQTAAGAMASAMETLATKLEENSSQSARDDVVTVSSAGRSMILFLRATADAEGHLSNRELSESQQSLIRAAVAYNTIHNAAKRTSSPEIKADLQTAARRSNELLQELLERQRSQYRQRLKANDTTMLERAQTYRRLSQLAALAGNQEEAATLQNKSQAAFKRYSNLVSRGNANLQKARRQRSRLLSSALISVRGRTVFWIGNIDTVTERRDRVVSLYSKAEKQFESAGAISRAETARAERQQFTQTMEEARFFSMVLGGVLGLSLLVILVLEARALYRYAQESTAATSGDFLLTHERT